jgi:hypothetical protein
MMSEYHLGCLEGSPAEVDLITSVCQSVGSLSADIPDTLGARDWLRINNQRDKNACCGNAADKALEFNRWLSLGRQTRPEDLSARFSYVAALQWANTLHRGDQGVSIEAGVMASRDIGAVLEEAWPYWQDGERFDTELPRHLVERAGQHRVRSVSRVTTGREVIEALGNGVGACVFGMYWTTGMSSYRGGLLAGVPGGPRLGGHAVCACDYDLRRNTIWVANSHGEQWGDRGWFEVTVPIFDQLLQQPFGAFIVSDLQGFPPRKWNWRGLMV